MQIGRLVLFFALLPLLTMAFAGVNEDDPLLLIADTYLENPTRIRAEPSANVEDPLCAEEGNDYTVNFDDIPVIQLIRFISQISNRNFVFDSKDIQFNITIVSEDATSVDDLMAALLQVLRMHNLSVVEQGNNVLIYSNQALSKVSTIVSDSNVQEACAAAVITRVFRLYNLAPDQLVAIIRPLVSKDATVDISKETRHLIVTDITANVEKIAELIVALDTPDAAFDVGYYKVKYAIPTILVTYAREILAPLAQSNPLELIPQSSQNKVFIVSTHYLIEKALQVLESLDSPDITNIIHDLPPTAMGNNNFTVYKLKYHSGQEIAMAMQQIGANLAFGGVANVDLVNTIHSLQWIPVNNSLVISGTKEATDKVLDLIAELDTAPKQVYIEVLILDTTLSNSLNFGVEWIALGNEQNKLAFASGFLGDIPDTAPNSLLTGAPQAPFYGGARDAQNAPPPDASRGGAPGTGGDIPLIANFGLGVIGNILRHNGQSILTLGALVKAVEQDMSTTVVLNPRIMTEDSVMANFFVGQNIPYQTTSTVVADTRSVTENIQYEDVGVQLRVRPQVAPGNVVTLDIDQAVSDVQNTSATISTVNGNTFLLAPTTNKTLTTTRVHVPDGCFLVMSGHVRDEVSYTRTGIPCLGTLPWIGPAFSRTEEQRIKRNLIMFLRPHVVSDVFEGSMLTDIEGYKHNWNTNPASLRECTIERAPEDACNAP